MRVAVLLPAASLALAFCGSAATNDPAVSSSTDQEIRPFSSLRWDDGLLDVVTKLNKLAGLKTLRWQVAGVTLTKSVLNVVTAEELSEFATALYDRPTTGEFTDHDGKMAVSPTSRWRPFITGEEINIAGIPFDLSANLELEPGFAVTYPDKIVSFKTKRGVAVLPAVLTSVELTSNSKVIVDNLSDLIATVKAKYPKGKISEVKQETFRSGTFVAVDRLDHEFKLTWTVGVMGAKARISYEDVGADSKWAELYRRHLAGFDERRLKGNIDLKTEL
jgi:hypothetical protein